MKFFLVTIKGHEFYIKARNEREAVETVIDQNDLLVGEDDYEVDEVTHAEFVSLTSWS